MPEKGSKKWIRLLINEKPAVLNQALIDLLQLPSNEVITWLSPLAKDQFAEYYDASFLQKVGLERLVPKLAEFWPKGGPRWDALATSSSGHIFLVEAKAHISELISYCGAKDPESVAKIAQSLGDTKKALGSKSQFDWTKTFYQYANRLAFTKFLRDNKESAYFVSVYFVNDEEMNGPKSVDEWEGAIKLLHDCMGLSESALEKMLIDVFISTDDLKTET